MVSKVQQEPC